MKQIFQALTIKQAVVSILWILLATHFLVVFIYLLPSNPVNHQYKRQIDGYVNPLFSQRWTLFSPNPGNSNQTIWVQFTIYNKNKTTQSSWIDIVTPLLEEKRTYFWTPTQRPLKFLSSCYASIIDMRANTWDASKRIDSLRGDTARIEQLIQQYVDGTDGHHGIMCYSRQVFSRMYPRQRFDSVYVGYRLVDARFPRLSKRDADYFDTKNYEYSVLSFAAARAL